MTSSHHCFLSTGAKSKFQVTGGSSKGYIVVAPQDLDRMGSNATLAIGPVTEHFVRMNVLYLFSASSFYNAFLFFGWFSLFLFLVCFPPSILLCRYRQLRSFCSFNLVHFVKKKYNNPTTKKVNQAHMTHCDSHHDSYYADPHVY